MSSREGTAVRSNRETTSSRLQYRLCSYLKIWYFLRAPALTCSVSGPPEEYTVPFTIGYGDETFNGTCCFRRHLAEPKFDTSGSKTMVTEILALRVGVSLFKENFESSRSPCRYSSMSQWRHGNFLHLFSQSLHRNMQNLFLTREFPHGRHRQTGAKPCQLEVPKYTSTGNLSSWFFYLEGVN